ncbi:hypothetical protein L1887_53009 [Cichorium endivia]|nr:hypothetical protein L1887_53009 [Cichorium endivia]
MLSLAGSPCLALLAALPCLPRLARPSSQPWSLRSPLFASYHHLQHLRRGSNDRPSTHISRAAHHTRHNGAWTAARASSSNADRPNIALATLDMDRLRGHRLAVGGCAHARGHRRRVPPVTLGGQCLAGSPYARTVCAPASPITPTTPSRTRMPPELSHAYRPPRRDLALGTRIALQQSPDGPVGAARVAPAAASRTHRFISLAHRYRKVD